MYFKRPLLYLLKESINHACGRVYNPRILNIDAILRPVISWRASYISIKFLLSICRILGNWNWTWLFSLVTVLYKSYTVSHCELRYTT